MRTFFQTLGLAFVALLLVPLAARPAETSFSCSVRQAFNFEKDRQDTIGVLESLTIAGAAVPADLTVTISGVGETKRVVGVLSGIQWSGGYSDPIQMSAQISEANRSKLAGLAHTAMSNTEVEFTFTVYEYDPKAKAYFPAFHSSGRVLKGLISKRGGELAFLVGDERSEEVPSPRNYPIMIGINPQDVAMDLDLAFSMTNKLVKRWGVSVGA